MQEELTESKGTEDFIARARTRADWRSVEQLYRQFSAIANDPERVNVMPTDVPSALAESSGRVLAHYDRLEKEFMEDLLHIWSQIDGLTGSPGERFRHLYQDPRLERFIAYRPPGEERRRPTPFEASIETCRRLLDLNRVRDALAQLPTSGILGGSTSYGRFFNVQGAIANKPSDLDLLLVLSDYALLRELPAALESVAGIDKESLEYFQTRIERLPDVRKVHDRCILSHKLKLWVDVPDPYLEQYQYPGHYSLSMHVLSWEDLEFIILRDKAILGPEEGGQFILEVFDYRDTEPTRLDNMRAFSGIDYSVPLWKQGVDGGFVSRVRVCQIVEERFCPGLYQNLVLPQFEIRWQAHSLSLYLPTMGFRWKVLERLREERRLRPYEVQNIPLSHTRYAVFAPHIVRRAGRE